MDTIGWDGHAQDLANSRTVEIHFETPAHALERSKPQQRIPVVIEGRESRAGAPLREGDSLFQHRFVDLPRGEPFRNRGDRSKDTM